MGDYYIFCSKLSPQQLPKIQPQDFRSFFVFVVCVRVHVCVCVCYNLILKMGLTDKMERPCFKLSILVSNGHFNALKGGGGLKVYSSI